MPFTPAVFPHPEYEGLAYLRVATPRRRVPMSACPPGLGRRHGGGVPMAHAILEVAEIAQQRGPRGAEAVLGVLEERLARVHRVDEVAHMDLRSEERRVG